MVSCGGDGHKQVLLQCRHMPASAWCVGLPLPPTVLLLPLSRVSSAANYTLVRPFQEARTLEELQLQRMERERAVAYFRFMQQQAAAEAAAKLVACDQLEEVLAQQLSAEPVVEKVAVNMQEQLEQLAQLRAEHTLMLRLSKRFECWQQAAAQRFASL